MMSAPGAPGCKPCMLGALPMSPGGCLPCPERRARSQPRDACPALPRNASCGGVRSPTALGRAGSKILGGAGSRPSSASALRRVVGDGAPQGMGLLGAAARLEPRAPCRMQQLREDLAERRAAEAAARIRKAAERKEQLQAARQAVVAAAVAAGASEAFGGQVAALMERSGALLKAWDGSDVDAAVLQEFTQAAKREAFSRKLLMRVPNWRLTELQKLAVVDRILQINDVEALSQVDQEGHIWQEALESAASSSEHFSCPICMEPLVRIRQDGTPDASNMWSAPLRKCEHWSNQPCGHACCLTCMKMWAETAINDQKTRVKCPAEGCSYSLWDQDLQALVAPEVFERHKEHKNADYLKHLKSELKADVQLKMWLKSHARPCPDCHVIVSRYEGCDAMQCVCGCSFCYACGCKKCQCRKSHDKKRDIWKPKASRQPQA